MQIYLEQNLTFLAVPKAGSTSIEAALRPFATTDVRTPPADRHMTAMRYRRHWEGTFVELHGKKPEVFAVLRDPLERLESWYRYRSNPKRTKSTDGMSFEAFVNAVLSEDPPPAAKIGSQHSFVSDGKGRVIVDHLFALENPDSLTAFLDARFGKAIRIQPRNRSAEMDVTLSPETQGRLYDLRAEEFALYDEVLEAGHFRP